MNIYVGNLSWSMTDDDLMNLFTQYGTVSSAKILKDKMNGRSKGFGFVEMEDDDAARTAISSLHEQEVMGRKLIVNESQPRPEGEYKKRPGGGGGFRGWIRRLKSRWLRWWRSQRRWLQQRFLIKSNYFYSQYHCVIQIIYLPRHCRGIFLYHQ